MSCAQLATLTDPGTKSKLIGKRRLLIFRVGQLGMRVARTLCAPARRPKRSRSEHRKQGPDMSKRRFFLLFLGLSLFVASAQPIGQTQGATSIEEIRKELMQLPYYGVFDFLAFKYAKGTVTLVGYAYHPGLKGDAERAVKRASGVDQVTNQIEELPASSMDDELRWKLYYKI